MTAPHRHRPAANGLSAIVAGVPLRLGMPPQIIAIRRGQHKANLARYPALPLATPARLRSAKTVLILLIPPWLHRLHPAIGDRRAVASLLGSLHCCQNAGPSNELACARGRWALPTSKGPPQHHPAVRGCRKPRRALHLRCATITASASGMIGCAGRQQPRKCADGLLIKIAVRTWDAMPQSAIAEGPAPIIGTR